MPVVKPGPLLIVAMCVVAVLTLNHVITVGSVLPTLIREWQLNNTQAGWLNGIFFAGYITGVPVLNALTDRIDPKRVFLWCSALSMAAAFVFAALADGFWFGLILRFISGIGLAGTYTTGLKALADCFEGRQQSRAVTFYSSCYSIGTAFSIFLGGALADWFGWRASFWGCGVAAAIAFVIVLTMLPDRPPRPGSAPAGHMLDFRPVLRNHSAMTFVLLSLGHIWEMFGNRMWLVAFFTYVMVLHPGEITGFRASDLAGITALAAVPFSMIMGEIAGRGHRYALLTGVAIASTLVGCVVGFSASWPIYAVLAMSILYSITAFCDSGMISAGTIAAAEPSRRGATVALGSFMGNIGGLVAPVMVGVTLDVLSDDMTLAWGVAFMVMALGSVFCALVLFTRARTDRGSPGFALRPSAAEAAKPAQ